MAKDVEMNDIKLEGQETSLQGPQPNGIKPEDGTQLNGDAPPEDTTKWIVHSMFISLPEKTVAFMNFFPCS